MINPGRYLGKRFHYLHSLLHTSAHYDAHNVFYPLCLWRLLRLLRLRRLRRLRRSLRFQRFLLPAYSTPQPNLMQVTYAVIRVSGVSCVSGVAILLSFSMSQFLPTHPATYSSTHHEDCIKSRQRHIDQALYLATQESIQPHEADQAGQRCIDQVLYFATRDSLQPHKADQTGELCINEVLYLSSSSGPQRLTLELCLSRKSPWPYAKK